MMMKLLQTLLVMILALPVLHAQGEKEKVSFVAEDGVVVTADRYLTDEAFPYILLFHQAGSSRGEFTDIADRFQKLRYNCLAVDLRSGKSSNYIQNETAKNADIRNASVKFLDAAMDIRAAIDYAWELNREPMILLGSSYSASLVMLEGEKNPNVSAVIAFSPGEYFGKDLRMEDRIDTISKPLFVAVTEREEPYVRQMMSGISGDAYTLFRPEAPGKHGARALWEDNPSKDEYWLALLLFINNLNR